LKCCSIEQSFTSSASGITLVISGICRISGRKSELLFQVVFANVRCCFIGRDDGCWLGLNARNNVERLHEAMRYYSVQVVKFLSQLLAPYSPQWKLDFASFRPLEEEGRDLPLHSRRSRPLIVPSMKFVYYRGRHSRFPDFSDQN
jgi:hypothetical protein